MNRTDLYTTVTDKIIAQLEAGVRPWSKPWAAGNAAAVARPLRWNGQPYRAFYRPSTDQIVVPAFVSFRDPQSYYATLAHECTHWTGAEHRLARKFDGSKRFGGEAYAMEELVAELGAAFLCADLGLAMEPREDHAAYLESWLKALKADNRAIFTAATFATTACDYLHGLQPGAGQPAEAEEGEEAPAPAPAAQPAQLGLQLA
jgi:antirestriction protein ArdC